MKFTMKNKKKLSKKIATWIIASSALVSANTQADQSHLISLNDVTILLPLPQETNAIRSHYLGGHTILTSGALVPSQKIKLFKDWERVQPELDLRQRSNLEKLTVLGIRLDPCFKDRFTDICRPQVRLVLQPIRSDLTAADLGIHLFFDTTEDQIQELVQTAANYRMKYLGENSHRAPLQIHPVIRQEGAQGAFWGQFRAKLLQVLNQANPSRIAFFIVFPNQRAWSFQSFDTQGPSAKVVPIHGISGDNTKQNMDNEIRGNAIEFITSRGILPRSNVGTDQTFDFLIDSTQFKRSGLSRINPLIESIHRIEDPTRHLPGTIDCLSCHSTPAIKLNLVRTMKVSDQTPFVSQALPTSSLLNITSNNYESRDFRLLGYRNNKAIIGQRVINESASVVDFFSRK